MKVAFWSGLHKEGGVTGTMAAVAAVCALHYKRRVVLTSDHFSNKDIKDCFSKVLISRQEAEAAFCYYYGEAEYFRRLWENDRVQANSPFGYQVMEGLYLLKPPDLLELSLFRETVPKNMLFFLDVAGTHHSAARQALEEADLVAVFLPQNMSIVRAFFGQYSSLIPKAIFFISNYQSMFKKRAECSPTQFVRNFEIDSQKVSTIPHNQDFAEAYEEGMMEDFIRKNLSCTPKNKNYNFMQQLFAAAEMILSGEKGVTH